MRINYFVLILVYYLGNLSDFDVSTFLMAE